MVVWLVMLSVSLGAQCQDADLCVKSSVRHEQVWHKKQRGWLTSKLVPVSPRMTANCLQVPEGLPTVLLPVQ